MIIMYEKRIMTSEELVYMMKNEKNITFKYMSEDTAKDYLQRHNNYFRIASYRKNYDKSLQGENAGKYIALDFAYLSELATIDMHLRFLVIKMCLDIEHSLKVKLLSDITNNEFEDGYEIVKVFLSQNEWITHDIYYKRHSSYVGDLINKYFTFETHISNNNRVIFDSVEVRCPIWALMEIIGFGELVKFLDFYYEAYPDTKYFSIGVLNSVKSLRNACAHNNCVIHNLRKGYTKPTREISTFISEIEAISKSERKSKLSIRPLYEIVSLLYLYSKIVFDPVKKYRLKEVEELVCVRMIKHKDYFEDQQIIKASYSFLKKVVDFLV